MKKYFLIGLIFASIAQTALGQGCSVCTKVAAGLGDKSAKGLNGGIIYLALLPLTCIGTIGFVWWKHNRKTSGTEGEA